MIDPRDYDVSTETGVLELELAIANEKIEKLQRAYKLMRNSAAGYSNCIDDSYYTATVKRCEKEYNEAEQIFRPLNT